MWCHQRDVAYFHGSAQVYLHLSQDFTHILSFIWDVCNFNTARQPGEDFDSPPVLCGESSEAVDRSAGVWSPCVAQSCSVNVKDLKLSLFFGVYMCIYICFARLIAYKISSGYINL